MLNAQVVKGSLGERAMGTASLSLGIPVYGIAYDEEQRLLAAVGGGGSSKSGVENKIVRGGCRLPLTRARPSIVSTRRLAGSRNLRR